NSRHMGMSDETEAFKPLKNAHEFPGVGINVVGKDVFIDRPPGRGMNRDEIVGSQAYGETSQEFPSPRAALGVGILLETFASPIASLFGALVEIERLVKNGKVVITHQRGPA